MDQLNFTLKSHNSLQKGRSFLYSRKRRTRWWGPVWRGLPVEPTGKHYLAMRSSLWLYIYLVIHANRKAGTLYRMVPTIATDMGISVRTIHAWLKKLRAGRYIITESNGRALKISITKWKGTRIDCPPVTGGLL